MAYSVNIFIVGLYSKFSSLHFTWQFFQAEQLFNFSLM